jgi:hypothetical protein
MAQTGEFKSVRDTLWPLFVHPARHDNVALKRAVFKMMDDTGPETFIRQQKAIMSRPDSRPSLGAIHCPTLVLVGNEDALTPVSVALTIADGIAGSKLEIVQECGHLSPMARSGNSGVERLDCLVKFIGKSTFDLVDRGAIDSIGHPNAADIAKTDEQHGRFSGPVLRSSMVLERYDVSDPRAYHGRRAAKASDPLILGRSSSAFEMQTPGSWYFLKSPSAPR